MVDGRYLAHPHFERRCRERNFGIADVRQVIATATSCVSYPDARSFHDGTSWRIVGQDTDGTTSALGVETFRDHMGRRVLLITVMDHE